MRLHGGFWAVYTIGNVVIFRPIVVFWPYKALFAGLAADVCTSTTTVSASVAVALHFVLVRYTGSYLS